MPDYVTRDFEGAWEEERASCHMFQNETLRTGRKIGRATRRPAEVSYWLISRIADARVEVHTLYHDGEETLPVFSHQEEAEMFLQLGEAGDGWRTTESRAGGLIWVLYGPCACVKRVALDPLPEMVAERTVGLVSLSRERFVERVVDGPGLVREPALARW